MELIKTLCGNDMLIYNRFMYTSKKKSITSIRWECRKAKEGCKGGVTMDVPMGNPRNPAITIWQAMPISNWQNAVKGWRSRRGKIQPARLARYYHQEYMVCLLPRCLRHPSPLQWKEIFSAKRQESVGMNHKPSKQYILRTPGRLPEVRTQFHSCFTTVELLRGRTG